MKVRKAIISIASLLLLAMLVPVAFADTTPTPSAVKSVVNNEALNKEQVDQVKPYWEKMLEAKKELLQEYVAMGRISQEDANARIQRMEQNMKSRMENGFFPGSGKGRQGGCGMSGGGCGNCYMAAPDATSTAGWQL